ncbi:MAG TPA: decaprenylphosphoryl-beta-D-ribose oxidase, partial [Acidimicrobiaceae bacterium]|nr:decaprenylphosphoryl-beta-D-ribose oxidase [Acidimicrobiaceae bacterium]
MRGLGRSYGDSAQNSGGLVLRLEGAAHEAVLDEATGTVTVPAGVSLDDLLKRIVPRGWFVHVTPGTRFVTIGGAIASDVHGKGHHVTGSFGDHVRSLRLLLADGTVADVGPDRRPELFWATVGGMGLTGVILDATFSLLPIETSRMSVDTTRLDDLDELFAALEEGDDDYRYSVAWIDPVGRGRYLGRSVLGRGDHATLAQLSAREQADPLAYSPKVLAAIPPLDLPVGLINRTTITAFNELWFRKAPRSRVGEVQTIATFWHPLDMVGGWNRLYGARGMVQYQFVVPFGQENAVRAVLEQLTAGGATSFLSVLKRFGPG